MLSLLLFACTENPPPPPVPPPAPPVEAPAEDRYPTALTLDGTPVKVDWEDGDTFKLPPETPDGKPRSARMAGFNTLESYGPVHRWGEWTGAELYAIAKEAGVKAASQDWSCTTLPGEGGYGRLLVDCPDLRAMMLREGYAHVFAVGSAAPAADLAFQQEAIAAKKGMWAKGAPRGLVTSLHSADEKGEKSPYNRVLDLSTGQANERAHTDTYTSCQEVCIDDSCMLYVPYELRYGPKRADCLK